MCGSSTALSQKRVHTSSLVQSMSKLDGGSYGRKSVTVPVTVRPVARKPRVNPYLCGTLLMFDIEKRDELRAPNTSRTGALGLKGRMSMQSGSLRCGEWNAVSKIRAENDGVGQTTRGHQLPCTFPCPTVRKCLATRICCQLKLTSMGLRIRG
jgi:hypothetical protein